MAIIKPENYKGAFPYWWEVRKVDEDRYNGFSKVTLSIYHSVEAHKLDKFNNILYEVAEEVPGIGLTNEQITEYLVSNTNRFKSGTNVGSNYNLDFFTSKVFVVDDNLDPINGLKRAIECISYTMYLNSNFLIIMLRVHFYPNIIVNIPDPDNEGEFIYNTQISENYDIALDREIAWVIDNSQIYENSGIGQFDYFLNLRKLGLSDEEIIVQGIKYGLQLGSVNKRLYGI